MTPLLNQIKLPMTLLCLVIVVPLSAAKRLRSEEKMSFQMSVHEGVGEPGCPDNYFCVEEKNGLNCEDGVAPCNGLCCPNAAPRKALVSKARGRKLGKKAKRTMLGQFLPGGAEFYSAGKAKAKSDLLYAVAQEISGEDYDFRSDITTVKHAIQFVSNKKNDKAIRQGSLGTVKAGTTLAITATSATVGSIIPGLGTAAGTVGGLGAGYVLSPVIWGGSRLKRLAKWTYKYFQGTQGKHRGQAADVLFHAWAKKPITSDGKTAAEALFLILGQTEFEYMTNGKSESGKIILQKGSTDLSAQEKFCSKWMSRIGARMKSV